MAQTRSGNEYSPWVRLGKEIIAPSTFNFEEEVKRAVEREDAHEEAEDILLASSLPYGNGVDWDAQVRGRPPDVVPDSLPARQCPDALISPTPASAHSPMPPPATQLPPALLPSHSENPPPSIATATPQPPTATIPPTTAFDDSISKEKYRHKRKRREKRRNARAADPQDPEMNRPIKKVSFKRNIAIPITVAAVAAAGSSPSAFMNTDPLNTGSVDIQHEPVRTQFDFEHDSARATSGFLGKSQRAAGEDRERVHVEDFPGFEYIGWDGR